jgi:phosphoenolpyruvate-protein kinase (PTS system EI component)
MTSALLGVGVTGSRPVAIGNAFLLASGPLTSAENIPPDHIGSELARLDDALACARRHLESVRTQIPASTPMRIA